jgi:SAM-dependent methyltransferase
MSDIKRLVQEAYDNMAERCAAWAQQARQSERARYTRVLFEKLAPHARILELGCGAGVPTTRLLAERYSVIGIDISKKQIELARLNVPGATFIVADMTTLHFAPESFDAIIAFYSIIHVPRSEHPILIQNIYQWLRPGGLFMAMVGQCEVDQIEHNWLGVPMYFSSWDSQWYHQMIEHAGLQIIIAQEETGEEVAMPKMVWIEALKPEKS